MNPAVILTLISELYGQVSTLAAENARLKEQLAARDDAAGQDKPPP